MLGAADYQLLSLEAPNVPPEELKTSVGWRLKDMLDFPLADATIDVFDIPPDQNAPVRGKSVFAVAARNSAVAPAPGHVYCGQDQPVGDRHSRNGPAQYRRPAGNAGRGLAMLSFDADGGLLTVNFNAELYLSRRIDVKLAQLAEGSDDQKHQYYDKITLELQRSFDHFDRQFHFINVIKLMLAPTGTDGLHGYLADNLYMPVEVLDLAGVFEFGDCRICRKRPARRAFSSRWVPRCARKRWRHEPADQSVQSRFRKTEAGAGGRDDGPGPVLIS